MLRFCKQCRPVTLSGRTTAGGGVRRGPAAALQRRPAIARGPAHLPQKRHHQRLPNQTVRRRALAPHGAPSHIVRQQCSRWCWSVMRAQWDRRGLRAGTSMGPHVSTQPGPAPARTCIGLASAEGLVIGQLGARAAFAHGTGPWRPAHLARLGPASRAGPGHLLGLGAATVTVTVTRQLP